MQENGYEIYSEHDLNFFHLFDKILINLEVQNGNFSQICLILLVSIPFNKEIVILKFIINHLYILLFVIGYFND